MKLKPFNTSVAVLLLGVIIGILLQNTLKISFQNGMFLMCFLFIIAFFSFFLLRKFQFIISFFLAITIGIFSFQVHSHTVNSEHYLHRLKQGKKYFFEGKINSIKNKRAIVVLKYVDKQRVTGKVALLFSDELPLKNIGDNILFRTQLKEIKGIKNPYDFDYKSFMEKKQVFWQGYIFSRNYKITPEKSPTFLEKIKRLQNEIAFSIDRYSFSPQSKGIIKALLLGIRDEIDTATYQDYVDAGAVHILAISGLHIGIIALIVNTFFSFLFGRFSVTKKYGFICTIFVLWGYAFLTGLSASVVRAVVMFSFLQLSLFLGKRQGRYDFLLISMFILLIFNPFYLFEIGFQLSYLAVFSIVTFLPILKSLFQSNNKIINYLYNTLVVGLSAQIGVLPLSLYYFGQFPSLFFITNWIILPFLGLVLAGGLIVLFLAYFNFLSNEITQLYSEIIDFMNVIISKIASVEVFVFKNIYFSFFTLIVLFIIIICSAFWLHFRRRILLLFPLYCVILLQGIAIFEKVYRQTSAEFYVFNGYKNMVIAIRKGEKITFFCENSKKLPAYFFTMPLKMKMKEWRVKSLPSLISFYGENFYIPKTSEDLLVIAPKSYIILCDKKAFSKEELKQVYPKKVISQNEWWAFFCKKENIPFHSTNEKGYFTIMKRF